MRFQGRCRFEFVAAHQGHCVPVDGGDPPVIENPQGVEGSGVIDAPLEDHVRLDRLGIVQVEDQSAVVDHLDGDLTMLKLAEQ